MTQPSKPRIVCAAILVAALSGCGSELDPTKKDGSGSLRHELYKECMGYALKFDKPTTSLSLEDAEYGDGIAEVIKQCTSSSWYMANHITDDG